MAMKLNRILGWLWASAAVLAVASSSPHLLPAARAGSGSQPAGNIFAPTPPESAASPAYATKKRAPEPAAMSPAQAMMEDSSYADQVRALPTLAPEQRKQLDKLIQDERKEAQPLAEELRAVRDQLRVARQTGKLPAPNDATGAGSPDEPGSSRARPLPAGAWLPGQAPAISVLEARAQALEQQMSQRKQSLWAQMRSVLSVDQLRDLYQMRKGMLIIPGVLDPRPMPHEDGPLSGGADSR